MVSASDTEVRLPGASTTDWVMMVETELSVLPSVMVPSGANRLPACSIVLAWTVMPPPADSGMVVSLPAGAANLTLPGVSIPKVTAVTG